MFYSVIIECGDTKKEILTSFVNKQIETSIAELGQALAAFVPPEEITQENWGKYYKNCSNNWEMHFANTLYKFYSECEKDNALYNERFFIYSLTHNSCDNYYLPQSISHFDKDNKKRSEYILRRKTEYQNKIDYMLAVAYELVERKITLNRCRECGKWFVAYNKIDTLFCVECATARTKRRRANETLVNTIKHNCEVRKSFNNDYTSKYYNKYEDIKNLIIDRQPDTKTATLAELKEYGEWLKDIKKKEFPRIKKGE